MNERFTRFTKPEGECLIWTGKRDSAGWGAWSTPVDLRPYYGPVERRAASWVAAWKAGLEHPDEFPKDHLVIPTCGNKLCVLGDHIMIDAARAEEQEEVAPKLVLVQSPAPKFEVRTASTSCALGHPYDQFGSLRSDGYFRCRECHRVASRRYKREGRKLGPNDPCMNGHGPEFKRKTFSNGRSYLYCSECRSVSTIRRNNARKGIKKIRPASGTES